MIGKLKLPAGVHGGAITYKLRPGGRQYVVVAAGGHDQIGSPKGDYIFAWALPGGAQPPPAARADRRH
jgi:glucose dehydrogenase